MILQWIADYFLVRFEYYSSFNGCGDCVVFLFV